MNDMNQTERLPAPHGARILAWSIDLLIVSTVLLFLPQPLNYLLFIFLLICYHTLLTWLLGQTLGKSLFGLRVDRLTRSRSLLWSFGRSSFGYIFVDVLGIGCVIGFFNKWHRCPHDYVFNSVVAFGGSRPTNANEYARQLVRYAERQQQAIKDKKKPIIFLSAFWASLEYIGGVLQKLLNLIIHPGQAATPTGSSSVAAIVSAKTAAAIAVVTTAVTSAIVATIPQVREVAEILVEPRFIWRWSGGTLPLDDDVVAMFEFDKSTDDISGNGRHAKLIGGKYVETSLGMGLLIPATDPAGIDWSDYASTLTAPYTVEVILTPTETAPWGKLFSFDDADDNGWYYKSHGLQSYPHPVLGQGSIDPGHRHYLAFVVRAADDMTIFVQGEMVGKTNPGAAAPPSQAMFFRDDTATGRGEQLEAVVEALRISKVARSSEEIMEIEAALQSE